MIVEKSIERRFTLELGSDPSSKLMKSNLKKLVTDFLSEFDLKSPMSIEMDYSNFETEPRTFKKIYVVHVLRMNVSQEVSDETTN